MQCTQQIVYIALNGLYTKGLADCVQGAWRIVYKGPGGLYTIYPAQLIMLDATGSLTSLIFPSFFRYTRGMFLERKSSMASVME